MAKKKIDRFELQKIAEEKGYPYVAMDENNSWWLYDIKPIVDARCNYFYNDEGGVTLDGELIDIINSSDIEYSGDWRDSLTTPESKPSNEEILKEQIDELRKEVDRLKGVKEPKEAKNIELVSCLYADGSGVNPNITLANPSYSKKVTLLQKKIGSYKYDLILCEVNNHTNIYWGNWNAGIDGFGVDRN